VSTVYMCIGILDQPLSFCVHSFKSYQWGKCENKLSASQL